MRGNFSVGFMAGIGACCCGLLCTCVARGQAEPIKVPRTECTCNPNPIMGPPECEYDLECWRTDGAPEVVDPGTPAVVTSIDLVCNSCSYCCTPNAPTMTCQAALEVCDTRSFDFSIAPGLEVGIEQIKLSLVTAFNFVWETSRCWEVQVGSNNWPPCSRGKFRAELDVLRNHVVRITSTYQWKVIRTGGDPQQCGEGYSWHNTCQEKRYSTLTSTLWGEAEATSLPMTPCGN